MLRIYPGGNDLECMEICCKDVPHSINYNVREQGALPRRAGTIAEQLHGSYGTASTNQYKPGPGGVTLQRVYDTLLLPVIYQHVL